MPFLRNVFVVVSALFVLSCSDEAQVSTLSDLINEAAVYLGDAIPDYENDIGRGKRFVMSAASRDTEFITPSVWSSTTPGDLIDPPGGVVSDPGGEPNYEGAALPTKVNYRDYMKMALDPAFKRASDGGTTRPTVFGRFDSLTDILGHMESAGITVDADGLPATGEYSVNYTVDSQALRILASVTATSDSTYYDRKIDLIGFSDTNSNGQVDGGEAVRVDTLMWVRATSSELNFMMQEGRDADDDGDKDSMSLNVLKWNKTTGAFSFEYVSDTNEDQDNGNLEIFRAFIEGTGGKTYVYGWTGKADPADDSADYLQYALYTPLSTETEGTVSLRQLRTDGDIWLGNLCSTFTTGAAVVGDTTGDPEPASGGTCSGQVSDSLNTKAGIMGFAFGVRANDTWVETADDKGFPATANTDLSVEANRSAWLDAGEGISVSFSNRANFISHWDGTP